MQSKTATLTVHPWYLQIYSSILCSSWGSVLPIQHWTIESMHVQQKKEI